MVGLPFLAPVAAMLALLTAYLVHRQLPTAPEHDGELGEQTSVFLRVCSKTSTSFLCTTFVALLLLYFSGWLAATAAPFFLLGGLCSAALNAAGLKFATRTGYKAVAQTQELGGSEPLLPAWRSASGAALMTAGSALLCSSLVTFLATNISATLSLRETSLQTLGFALGAATFSTLIQISWQTLGLTTAVSGQNESPPMGWQVRHTSALLAEWQDSYTSSILLSVPLGLAAALALAPTDTAAQARIALLPFALFGVGLLGSLVAFLAIKPRLDSPSNKLSRQLQRADLLSTGVTAVGSLAVCGYLLKGLRLPGAFGWWGLWGCLGVGFLLNIVIGILVDQTRSRAPGNDGFELRAVPHRLLRLGPTLLFALLVGFGAFALGGGFSQMQSGFFGVALVSNGLLLPMATNLSCGLFGILITNAAAKEMVEPGALHLATSRWRSIAASTSVILALLIVYSEALKVRLVQLASEQSSVLVWAKTTIDEVQARAATNQELALWYDAGLLNPLLLAALLLGSTLLFLAPAFTLSTALKLSPTKPQDESASESLTLWLQGSQMRACYLVALALLISLASGMLGGPTAVIGLLLGGLITGLPLLVVLEESTPGRAELSPPLGALLRLLALLSIILSGLVVSLSPLIAGKLGLFP